MSGGASFWLSNGLWCAVQVTLPALCGWWVARRAARGDPRVGAAAAATAAIVVLVLTLITPMRPPHFAFFGWYEPADAGAAASANRSGSASGGEDPSLAQPLWTSLPLAKLSGSIKKVVSPGPSSRLQNRSVVGWTVVLFGVGMILSLSRYAVAVYYAQRIRRSSSAVIEPSALGRLACIVKRVSSQAPSSTKLARLVCLRESNDLSSAAVIGWRRPWVILPAQWRQWSEEELEAVLAHEWAHIVRRDYLWRGAAVVAKTLHFYHPLVHLLTRQLTLAQELAADRQAAQIVGGHTIYLRALSKLAIRQDDQQRLCTGQGVLPVFSEDLIRRINMLQSMVLGQKNGKYGMHGKRTKQNFARYAAVGAVVLLGMIVWALRGAADPPSPRVAARPRPAVNGSRIPRELFHRPPLDVSVIGRHDQGMYVFRVGELLRREKFRSFAALINQAAAKYWRETFSTEVAPAIHFEALEFVAGRLHMTVDAQFNEDKGREDHRLMLGSDEFVFRFQQEVDWRSWVEKHIPGAELAENNGVVFCRLPVIPAIGPARMCVAARDSRTLVVTTNEKKLPQIVHVSPEPPECEWATDWKEAEGGLFTALATDKNVKPSAVQPNEPESAAMHQFLSHTKRFVASVDLNEETSELAVKLRLLCADRGSAETVQTGVRSLLEIAERKRQAEGENTHEAAAENEIERCLEQMIDQSSIKLVDRPDSRAEVVIESVGRLPLLAILQEFAKEFPGK